MGRKRAGGGGRGGAAPQRAPPPPGEPPPGLLSSPSTASLAPSTSSSTPLAASGLLTWLAGAAALGAALAGATTAPQWRWTAPSRAAAPTATPPWSRPPRGEGAAEDAPLVVVVNENGGPRFEGEEGEAVVRVSRSSRLSATLGFGSRAGKYRAWNEDGRLIRSFAELEQSPRDALGRVHVWRTLNFANRHFIWPATPRVRRFTDLDQPVEMTLVSESPRVFFVSNLVGDAEIESLLRRASDPSNPYSFRPSTTGAEAWSPNQVNHRERDRTSENAFDVDSPTAKSIFRRGFALLRLPPHRLDMFDGLQIVRYFPEQAYKTHLDAYVMSTPVAHSYDFNASKPTGGNRFATLFLYLTDVEMGGQTLFPLVPTSAADPETRALNASLFGDADAYPAEAVERAFQTPPGSWERQLIKLCYSALSINPRRGSAVLFYSLLGNNSIDELANHAACPVVEGSKIGANFWAWSSCRYGLPKCQVEQGAADPLEWTT